MKKVGVFISIPKCGSKTILELYKLGKNRDNDKRDKTHPIIYENHQRMIILEKRYDLSDKFVFTFVRHPYGRVISWFNYHKYSKKKQHNEIYKNLTLNEWIEKGCPTHWVKQNSTEWEKEGLSPLLQYNFIESNKGRKIDYIGRMETFEEDNKKIINIINRIYEENKIDIELEYEEMIENSSKKKETNLSDKSKEIIYELFNKDFEFFGYDP